MYIQLVCILPMDLLARAEEIGQSGRGLGEEHTVEAVGHVILIGVGGGEETQSYLKTVEQYGLLIPAFLSSNNY